MLPVLIVEDQPAVGRALEVLLSLHSIRSRVVRGSREALAALAEGPWGCVLQDMNFSPGATSGAEGTELFRELRRREPALPVVLLTAWSSLESAVALVREGASDYLAKPWDDEALAERVRTLLEARAPELVGASRARLAEQWELCDTVWASSAMGRAVELAVRAASSHHPVLITGPSGSGKEKIAEIVHANSPRRERPLVRVHAGALPESLLEAELFGVESGAFTGAVRRPGRFETADRGSLLLDEIGTLPLAGQAKLLRILQRGELERLGSSATRRVDVRVISSTNEDLEAAVSDGRFRADLYWRLAVVRISVPALVDRPGDALAIAESVLAELAPSPQGHAWRLGESARRAIEGHDWPGNVRELQNAVHRATLAAPGPELAASDLGLVEPDPHRAPPSDPGRREVELALRASGGVVAHAAERLGISRQALYRRMERYGLSIARTVE